MAYEIRNLDAAFTRAFQESLSWNESTHFLVIIPIFLRSILIVSSHLRLGLHKGLFPVGLPIRILKESYLLPWRAHVNFLDLITLTILVERYKLWRSSLWSLLHSLFCEYRSKKSGWGRWIFQDVKILSTSPPGETLSWGSRVWDFRLVKEPQAWKSMPLSTI